MPVFGLFNLQDGATAYLSRRFDRQIGSLESSVSTIRNSFLPDDLKMEYAEILCENTARFSLSE
ncbi:MAG TPA: hypothetical protein DC058_24685 [Planctomycetaceae bacterium]|nr:hypothetical protein [Planctomycetaceae bacterium]HBC64398.1 hypothetical protein [Planctomycetaceae bacterium]